jgi:hypothetical protein
MVVWNWQQLGFSRIKPSLPWYILTLWAVAIPAGIIGNPIGATMIAPFNMTAKFGGSAT